MRIFLCLIISVFTATMTSCKKENDVKIVKREGHLNYFRMEDTTLLDQAIAETRSTFTVFSEALQENDANKTGFKKRI